MKKFVIAAALLAVGVSTAASAQYYSPYNNSQYLPQPRTAPPTYIPEQYNPPGQFNPPPPQPTIGNLPAYNNYCMSLGGQLTTNCNR
jgi:hypothetical protein